MKSITLHSKEFERVLKNMEIENLYLSNSLQKKALDLVNSGQKITPSMIKESLANS